MHIGDLQEEAQEQRYRYGELEELVASYIKDIDALHKYSTDRFADVKSANERVDEVLSLLKSKTDENEALLQQLEQLRSQKPSPSHPSSNPSPHPYPNLYGGGGGGGGSSESQLTLHSQQARIRHQLQHQQVLLQQQIDQHRAYLGASPRMTYGGHVGGGGGGGEVLHLSSPPPTVATMPRSGASSSVGVYSHGSEVVDGSGQRVFTKLDPDDEALEHGILLSKQLEKYGVTMYESIRPEDEVVIADYLARGYSREEAVLIIFEAKHGPVSASTMLSIPTLNLSSSASRG